MTRSTIRDLTITVSIKMHGLIFTATTNDYGIHESHTNLLHAIMKRVQSWVISDYHKPLMDLWSAIMQSPEQP